MYDRTSSLLHVLTTLSLFGTFFHLPITVRGNAVCDNRNYALSTNIVGESFFNHFVFQNIRDPTNGAVTYVDAAQAKAKGLATATSNSFILRADDKTKLKTGAGRESVRVASTSTVTTHVAIFNIRHMPQGCGTWPAVWETQESSWPDGGEIDILEGVNDQGPNRATLHTKAGCTMPGQKNSIQTGVRLTTVCNAAVLNNQGCGVQFPADSYGPTFNNEGGGWYVIERNSCYINIWFWGRNDKSVPAEVAMGHSNINTASWGKPTASFPGETCNMGEYFAAQNIIINLTFCGDWAGAAWGSSGECSAKAGSCAEYVANNPSAFSEAYFEFESILIYELTG